MLPHNYSFNHYLIRKIITAVATFSLSLNYQSLRGQDHVTTVNSLIIAGGSTLSIVSAMKAIQSIDHINNCILKGHSAQRQDIQNIYLFGAAEATIKALAYTSISVLAARVVYQLIV